ncbi:hypothetical protein ACPCBC_21765 [Streptomyces incarnatus]
MFRASTGVVRTLHVAPGETVVQGGTETGNVRRHVLGLVQVPERDDGTAESLVADPQQVHGRLFGVRQLLRGVALHLLPDALESVQLGLGAFAGLAGEFADQNVQVLAVGTVPNIGRNAVQITDGLGKGPPVLVALLVVEAVPPLLAAGGRLG